jgi:hypothetical protein
MSSSRPLHLRTSRHICDGDERGSDASGVVENCRIFHNREIEGGDVVRTASSTFCCGGVGKRSEDCEGYEPEGADLNHAERMLASGQISLMIALVMQEMVISCKDWVMFVGNE